MVANGTLALLLALKALDVKGEVITTPYSFVATSHVLNWNGLTPIGSTSTELANFLRENDCLIEWSKDRTPIDIQHAQSFCEQSFSPEVVYNELYSWVQDPKIIQASPTSSIVKENQYLRRTISEIHSSPTWRVGSKIQRLFKGD